ncbi:ABC transporter ATP-binding protein [Brevibacillus fluminis]|uniref:ABC transporter ATP-binding protein n=1 Tax=Brevibacillus fluminis TaxID=511487 RepID=UPI003F89CBD0
MSIRLEEIRKSYHGDGVIMDVLHGINMTFSQSDMTAIVGPSGSGKSTLLNIIGTLDCPSEGRVYFEEQEVTQLKGNGLADFRFREIGFIFQHFHLIPTMTALENVMLPLLPRKVGYDKKKRALELLEQVGLHKKINALPSQLSGGEQQRIAIARAMVNKPRWLLADEPTGNLDTANARLVFDLLRQFQTDNQTGIILITHDPAFARQADRSIRMRDGRATLTTDEGDSH